MGVNVVVVEIVVVVCDSVIGYVVFICLVNSFGGGCVV